MAQKYRIEKYSDNSVVLSNVRNNIGIPVFGVNETITATRVAQWYDGSAMDDSKVDGKIYLKFKGEGEYKDSYFKVNLPNDKLLFLEKDTMQEMRDMSSIEILLLEMGYYKGVKLNGYYDKDDTPMPIEYYISSTSDSDNGGSVIVISNIKLEHKFDSVVDIKYFGAIQNQDIKAKFQALEAIHTHILINGAYTASEELVITKSNTKVEFTNKASLKITKTGNSNGILINDNINNVSLVGNGVIEGNTTSSTVGYAIFIGNNSSDILVSGLKLTDFTGGILCNYNNNNCKFIQNSFYNMLYVPSVSAGGYGIVYQSSFNTVTSNNYFDESVERHNIYYAINTQITPLLKGKNHILSNNILKMKSLPSYITQFEYNVKIMGTDGVVCDGNILEGGVGGIWVTSFFNSGGNVISPSNINILGNVISGLKKGTSDYSSAIGAHGANTVLSSINITDNLIYDCDVRSGIDIISLKDSAIKGNKISSITNNGIYIDYYAENVDISNNIVKAPNRAMWLSPNSAEGAYSKGVKISNNLLEGTNFGIYVQKVLADLTISNNNIRSTSFQNIYINSATSRLSIHNNDLGGTGTNITLTALMTSDCHIHNNTFQTNRIASIQNLGTGYIFQPVGQNNIVTKASALPTTTTRAWLIGDIILNSNPTLSGWKRITNGLNNVLNVDWISDTATVDVKGTVNQSGPVADIGISDATNASSPTATDLATALTLLNELRDRFNASVNLMNQTKSRVNNKLSVDRTSGQQAT